MNVSKYDIHLAICWHFSNRCCLPWNNFCLPHDVATANNLPQISGSW